MLPPKKKRTPIPFSRAKTMDDIETVVKILEVENDKAAAADPLVKTSLGIVYDFLTSHSVMCYGGTAINNLLPPEDRFYDPKTTVPDYDFYSKTPQEHATSIANTLAAAGIASVVHEAMRGAADPFSFDNLAKCSTLSLLLSSCI